jgi:hypothetical protein
MKTEVRTFDDLVKVSQVGRYTPAERTGLLAGDLILFFGIHPPSAVSANSDLIATLKRGDWLFVLRGDVAFRLMFGEGIEGAQFESANPAENITVATGVSWMQYWGAMQTNGQTIFVPETITPWWAIVPPLLYARYRNWQMLAAILLVWLVALTQGPVTLALAYLVSVAAAMFGGASLMRDALQKQGFVPRGIYSIARHTDVAALEIITCERLRLIRQNRPATSSPKSGDNAAAPDLSH